MIVIIIITLNVNIENGDIKNIFVEISLIIIIFIYSAKKISANQPPIYSTLKPDTNSDSPSAKSKGLRFVSAKQDVIHIINNNKFPQKKCNIVWDIIISLKV